MQTILNILLTTTLELNLDDNTQSIVGNYLLKC
jgi:hypothetical protein